MIIAALLSFGILLLAWILAPDGVKREERTPAPRETLAWDTEPSIS